MSALQLETFLAGLASYRGQFDLELNELLHLPFGPRLVSPQERGHVDQEVVVGLHDRVAQA